jgi:asparagine synthase (glutamine-hydrolysing)
MLGDHAAGRADHHKILFSVVVLEQWLHIARERRPSRISASTRLTRSQHN